MKMLAVVAGVVQLAPGHERRTAATAIAIVRNRLSRRPSTGRSCNRADKLRLGQPVGRQVLCLMSLRSDRPLQPPLDCTELAPELAAPEQLSVAVDVMVVVVVVVERHRSLKEYEFF